MGGTRQRYWKHVTKRLHTCFCKECKRRCLWPHPQYAWWIWKRRVSSENTSNVLRLHYDGVTIAPITGYFEFGFENTPNANMADHSVGARDELHESEAREASVFCFDNASPASSCFVDGLVCLISLCLLVFVFLDATRRDKNCPTFASKRK